MQVGKECVTWHQTGYGRVAPVLPSFSTLPPTPHDCLPRRQARLQRPHPGHSGHKRRGLRSPDFAGYLLQTAGRGAKNQIYTYQHIKEDGQTLYGFLDPNEKALFMLLISVSGIGPGTGIVMVSSMSVGEIRRGHRERKCAGHPEHQGRRPQNGPARDSGAERQAAQRRAAGQSRHRYRAAGPAAQYAAAPKR